LKSIRTFNNNAVYRYDPKPTETWRPQDHNHFELRVFAGSHVSHPKEKSLRGILRDETDGEYVEQTWHFVCFMWKAVQDGKATLFALTSSQGYQVVKRWSNYRFPLQVALRLAEPKMFDELIALVLDIEAPFGLVFVDFLK